MIKQENLDFFLVQVFGQPALEPEESKSFLAVLAGKSDRLFLASPSAAVKPYLIGACLPGAMLSVYENEAVARQAADSLTGMGISVRFIPKELSQSDFDNALASVSDGSVKILLAPPFPLADPTQGPHVAAAIHNVGLNFVLVHDLLVVGAARPPDELVFILRQMYPRVLGAAVAKVVTSAGSGVPFPLPERIGAPAVGLTEEERDELLKPLPRAPAPPMPPAAFEPELDDAEAGNPTLMRQVSPAEMAQLAAAEKRRKIPPPVPVRPVKQPTPPPARPAPDADEGTLLSTLEGALAPSDDSAAPGASDEMGVDLEQLLGAPAKDETPELFVPRRAPQPPPPPPPLPPPPPPAVKVPEVDALDVFLKQKSVDKESDAELDDLLGIGRGAEEAPETDAGTLANLQALLSGEILAGDAPPEDPFDALMDAVGEAINEPDAEVKTARKSAPSKKPEPVLDPSFEEALSAAIVPVFDDGFDAVAELDGDAGVDLAALLDGDAAPLLPGTDLAADAISLLSEPDAPLVTAEDLLLFDAAAAVATDEDMSSFDGAALAVAGLDEPVESAPYLDDAAAAAELAAFDAAAAAASDLGGFDELLIAESDVVLPDAVSPDQGLALGADELQAFDAATAATAELSAFDEAAAMAADFSAFDEPAATEQPAAEPLAGASLEELAAFDAAAAAADQLADANTTATYDDAAAFGADSTAYEMLPPDVVSPAQPTEAEAWDLSAFDEAAAAMADGSDDLLMPAIEPGTDDDAPAVVPEPVKRARDADEDFDAEMFNALKMAGDTDEGEASPVAAPKAAGVDELAPDEEFARSLMSEIDEMTRPDAPAHKPASATVAIAADDDDPVSLSLDLLGEDAGLDSPSEVFEPGNDEPGAGLDAFAGYAPLDDQGDGLAPLDTPLESFEPDQGYVPDGLVAADEMIPVEQLTADELFSPGELPPSEELGPDGELALGDGFALAEELAADGTLPVGFGPAEEPMAGGYAVGDETLPVEGFALGDPLLPEEGYAHGEELFVPAEELLPADGFAPAEELLPADGFAGVEELLPADGFGFGEYAPVEEIGATDGFVAPPVEELTLDELAAVDEVMVAGANTSSAREEAGLELPGDMLAALDEVTVPMDEGAALAEVLTDGTEIASEFTAPSEGYALELPLDAGWDQALELAQEGLDTNPVVQENSAEVELDGELALPEDVPAQPELDFEVPAEVAATEDEELALAEALRGVDEEAATSDVLGVDNSIFDEMIPADLELDAVTALDGLDTGEAPELEVPPPPFGDYEAPAPEVEDLADVAESASFAVDELAAALDDMAGAPPAEPPSRRPARPSLSDDQLAEELKDLSSLDDLHPPEVGGAAPPLDRARYQVRPPPPSLAAIAGPPLVLEMPRSGSAVDAHAEARERLAHAEREERQARVERVNARAADAVATLDLFAAAAAAAAASATAMPAMRAPEARERAPRTFQNRSSNYNSKVLEISYWNQEQADILSGLSALSGSAPQPRTPAPVLAPVEPAPEDRPPQVPDPAPDSAPDAAPEAALEEWRDAGPEVSPDLDAAPEAAPALDLDAPEAVLDLDLDEAPDEAPELTLDTGTSDASDAFADFTGVSAAVPEADDAVEIDLDTLPDVPLDMSPDMAGAAPSESPAFVDPDPSMELEWALDEVVSELDIALSEPAPAPAPRVIDAAAEAEIEAALDALPSASPTPTPTPEPETGEDVLDSLADLLVDAPDAAPESLESLLDRAEESASHPREGPPSPPIDIDLSFLDEGEVPVVVEPEAPEASDLPASPPAPVAAIPEGLDFLADAPDAAPQESTPGEVPDELDLDLGADLGLGDLSGSAGGGMDLEAALDLPDSVEPFRNVENSASSEINLDFLDDDSASAAPAPVNAVSEVPSFLADLPEMGVPEPITVPATPIEKIDEFDAVEVVEDEGADSAAADLLRDLSGDQGDWMADLDFGDKPAPAPVDEDALGSLDAMLEDASRTRTPESRGDASAELAFDAAMDADLADLSAAFGGETKAPEVGGLGGTPLAGSLEAALEALEERVETAPAPPPAPVAPSPAVPALADDPFDLDLSGMASEMDAPALVDSDDPLSDLSDLLDANTISPGSLAEPAAGEEPAMDFDVPSFLDDAPSGEQDKKKKDEPAPAAAPPLPEVSDQAMAASRDVIASEPPPAEVLRPARKTGKMLNVTMLGLFADAGDAPVVPEDELPPAPPPPPPPKPEAAHGHGGHEPPKPPAPRLPAGPPPIMSAPGFLDDMPTSPGAPAPVAEAPVVAEPEVAAVEPEFVMPDMPEEDPLGGLSGLDDLGAELEGELEKMAAEMDEPAPAQISPDTSLDTLFLDDAQEPASASLDDLFGDSAAEPAAARAVSLDTVSLDEGAFVELPRTEEPEPLADVLPAVVLPEVGPEIGAQVSDVLRDILSEYPDEMMLKPAQGAPAFELPPPRPEVVREPEVEDEPPPVPVAALPPMTESNAWLMPEPVVPTRPRVIEPEMPPFPERPAMVPPVAAREHEPVITPEVQTSWTPAPRAREPEPDWEPAPPRRVAPPPPPPRRPEDIRQEFDLPREGHLYFYEMQGTYAERLDFLNRIWDDPDSDVDALVKLLPAIEKAFPEDARVPFAAGVLNMLAEKRVASLTGFNRALDLLDALGDFDGARVILKLLHGAFPDDVGVTERLVDVLDRLDQKVEAATILEELCQAAVARDHVKRALAYLERAAQLDATNLRVALAQVKIYRGSGDESRVLEAANRALAARPDDGLLLFYKAQALARLGRTRAAETCMDKALACAASDVTLLKKLREELRGSTDERDKRRVADAIAALDPESAAEAAPAVAPPPAAGLDSLFADDEGDLPPRRAPVPPQPLQLTAGPPRVPIEPLPPVPPPPAPLAQVEPSWAPPPPPPAPAAPALEGDLTARLKARFPRIAPDLGQAAELEHDLTTARGREMVQDKQVVELLKKLQGIGDKIRVSAPDEAALVYQKGLGYLTWFKDPFMAVAWRDELEKKIRAGAGRKA